MHSINTGGRREVYAHTFGVEGFIRDNAALFDEYTYLRATGYGSIMAFRLAFGACVFADRPQESEATEAIERTHYYLSHFEALREQLPLSDLWNARMAIDMLSQLALDERAPGAVRLGAYRELTQVMRDLPQGSTEAEGVAARVISKIAARGGGSTSISDSDGSGGREGSGKGL